MYSKDVIIILSNSIWKSYILVREVWLIPREFLGIIFPRVTFQQISRCDGPLTFALLILLVTPLLRLVQYSSTYFGLFKGWKMLQRRVGFLLYFIWIFLVQLVYFSSYYCGSNSESNFLFFVGEIRYISMYSQVKSVNLLKLITSCLECVIFLEDKIHERYLIFYFVHVSLENFII